MRIKNSVIAVYNAHDKAGETAGDGNRTAFWGKQGTFWGGLFGFLFGSTFFPNGFA